MEVSDPYGHPDTSRLAELATRQHGVVGTAQLRALGFSARVVHRRVEAGELHPIHRAVFAVGHRRLTLKGHWLAAVLACGLDALLSCHAATALRDLRPAPRGMIDVTAPGKHHHAGVRCHVSRTLTAADRTIIDGIPVTSLERTLLDYAETANPRQLRSALEAAERRELLDFNRIDELLARSAGRKGLKPLKAALAELTGDSPWLQSGLEEEFRELLRRAHLPLPRTNLVIAGELVDCVWPDRRLVAEVDGYGYHRARRSFEDDRRRDMNLQTAGWRVVRVTSDRMRRDAPALVGQLRALLDL